MHAIDGLILDGGGPPRVREHDLVGGDEVEADAADGQAGEHDGAVRVGLEPGHGGVALGRVHLAVDAGEGVVLVCQLGLDDVEEGGPLAEDDGFDAGFVARGVKDAEEGLDLGAAGFDVDGGVIGGFAEAGGGADEAVDFERFGATHWTAVLGLDDALDAFVAEHVGTRRDDGVVQIPEADGAFLSGINAQLQHVLEGLPVFGS